MSKELRHIISNLRVECSQFNANDVLVDARVDHQRLYACGEIRQFSLGDFPSRILNEARLNLKESGVNTLCVARGIVRLEIKGKEVHSPLVLVPLQNSTNRIQQTISFEEIDDAAFVNPFIVQHFKQNLEIELSLELAQSCDLNTIAHFCEEQGLKADASTCSIGNFHHHRYQVLRELEELEMCSKFNPALSALFGEGKQELPALNLSASNLFAADTNHESVFSIVEKSHAVIQGPPGTGKSQVICNLIGKALHAEQSILVVSEKYAALDVIQSKLRTFGLDRLCFIAGADRQSHQFLSSLKATWDFFESYLPSSKVNLMLSEQYEANLQMSLDLLRQPDLIGGVSFHVFHQLSLEFPQNGKFSSFSPSISDFVDHRAVLEQLFGTELQHSLSFLRKKTVESDTFLSFDQKIDAWQLQANILRGSFTLDSWNDLSLAMKDAAICQVFENDLFKRYASVFEPSSKDQKQFKRLAKHYQRLSRSEEIGSEWKVYPSLVESESLRKQLLNASFFERRKLKKRWGELSNLPFSEAQSALKKRLDQASDEVKWQKCLDQLSQLGITEPGTEIEQIQQTMTLFSEANWHAYTAIPRGKRVNITRRHSELSHLHSELLSAFKLDADTQLSEFFTRLKSDLPNLLTDRKNILELSSIDFQSMKNCATFTDFAALIFTSNHTLFKERFPVFSNFKPIEIGEKVDSILSAQSHEGQLHASQLLNSIHTQFLNFHALLNTPANRLNAEQKLVKKALKKGKSILVKEFGKTRSHPTLRELFQSEARNWISLLKPIWLSNPSSLANCFPMEQGAFDLLIFDEASQIPIQHALGGIQRSKRIVVAGDEHQMGPSSYFQAGSKDVQDLLHQASYYFPKIHLLHHYRSAHPELISFSNTHFYDGKLMAYPSLRSADDSSPIRHHFIENALFVDRINVKEAKTIADFIHPKLSDSESLGIVAFSEEQLNCIWKQLDGTTQEKLIAHQEKHGGFFKALENVQGDECDSLVIGFGYAPNETGDFHLRFGPMNTTNGRKRLNVLLTRARESIDFFCSVHSSDFKLSDNESINLLRQWIAFSEQNFSERELIFPHGLKPKIDGSSLVFDRIQELLPNAREVATMQGVLEYRGWKVSYS